MALKKSIAKSDKHKCEVVEEIPSSQATVMATWQALLPMTYKSLKWSVLLSDQWGNFIVPTGGPRITVQVTGLIPLILLAHL